MFCYDSRAMPPAQKSGNYTKLSLKISPLENLCGVVRRNFIEDRAIWVCMSTMNDAKSKARDTYAMDACSPPSRIFALIPFKRWYLRSQYRILLIKPSFKMT